MNRGGLTDWAKFHDSSKRKRDHAEDSSDTDDSSDEDEDDEDDVIEQKPVKLTYSPKSQIKKQRRFSNEKPSSKFEPTFTSNSRSFTVSINKSILDDIFYHLHQIHPDEEMPTWIINPDCRSMIITQEYQKKIPTQAFKAFKIAEMIPQGYDTLVEAGLFEEDWNPIITILTNVFFPFSVCVEKMKTAKIGNTLVFLFFKKRDKLAKLDEISSYDIKI